MTEQIVAVVAQWKALLRYFPSDPASSTEIMKLLARMIGPYRGAHGRTVTAQEQLEWLRTAMVDQVGEWRGAKELRGVFCSRFRPADGIEADCETGPFTPAALESAAHHAELTAGEERKLLTGTVEQVSADPALVEMIEELKVQMPEVKSREIDRRIAREWCEKHGLPI